MPASSASDKLPTFTTEATLLAKRVHDRQAATDRIGAIDELLGQNQLDAATLTAEREALLATIPDHDNAIILSGKRTAIVAQAFADGTDIPTLP